MTSQEILVPEDIAIIRDIDFTADGHRPLSLHLLKPSQAPLGPLPLIVWIFGGAWLEGNKDAGLPRLFPFVRHGYACASIEYRYSCEVLFPGQLHDCHCAIRFLRGHAPSLGIDPDQIGVWGASSGGNLASLIGVTAGFPEMQGDRGWPRVAGRVQAVCDWFGPTDLLQMDRAGSALHHDASDSPESLLVGGSIQDHPDLAARVNPISYINARSILPPFLIIHGDHDPLVPFNQSELLAAALQDAGADCTFERIVGGDHGGALFETEGVRRMMFDFFDSRLRSDA